jgi:hypothetical protein
VSSDLLSEHSHKTSFSDKLESNSLEQGKFAKLLGVILSDAHFCGAPKTSLAKLEEIRNLLTAVVKDITRGMTALLMQTDLTGIILQRPGASFHGPWAWKTAVIAYTTPVQTSDVATVP